MPKKTITDRTLKALEPASAGHRYEIMDAIVPGLAVRVTDKGKRTFVLIARFPGSRNSTRRALGEYGALTLVDARTKARAWIEIVHRGGDPKDIEQQERLAAARQRENSFAAVAEEFIRREVSKLRRSKEVEQKIRTELIARWAERPIVSIKRHDVVELIDDLVDKGALYQAHAVFAYTRRLFNWAIGRPKFGLEQSPCDRIKPKDAIGAKKTRLRTLTDDELRALWLALPNLEYPFGPLIRMLLLTGQRRNEVAQVSRPELDFAKALWEVPPERMKSKSPHAVPLVPSVTELLSGLPRFNIGDYVFSTTSGERPVSGFSKAKKRLDKLMLVELKKFAMERGRDPEKVTLRAWRFHDIRRTVRTHLSALLVSDVVCELVIAHAKPGLHKVYDQHAYLNEKREALELWAARLNSIVAPSVATVVSMPAARR